MMLHGVTGCGKTSFLRAGLIPYLEREPLRFEFIKDKSESNYKALFIRSTDNPLIMIAQAIYQFASEDISVKTFLGRETLKLPFATADFRNSTDFLKAVNDESRILIQTLCSVSNMLPKTLVLIVDQAEEVLTLNQKPEGELRRKRFFEFVSLFSRTRLDMKLMLAFRTEFFGRFVSECDGNSIYSRGIQQYLLDELTEAQLLDAITRPTSREDIPGYGTPFDHYLFSFQPGLAEEIAEDLKSTRTAQAKLSLMQLTCWNLYRRIPWHSGNPAQIALQDYRSMGGTEGQLEENINEALAEVWHRQQPSRRRFHSETKEIGRWKEVLSGLVKEQVDGTVTTEIVRKDSLRQAADRADCVMAFQEVMNYLSRGEVRLLRLVSVVDVRSGGEISAYSLGHDAVGLALRAWSERSKQEKTDAFRWRMLSIVPGILLVLTGAFLYLAAPQRSLWKAPLVIGSLLFLLGNFRRFGRLLLSFPINIYRDISAALLKFLPRRKERTQDADALLNGGFSQLHRFSLAYTAVSFVIPLSVGLVGFFQTQFFSRFLPGPTTQQVIAHMEVSQTLQDGLRKSYKGQIEPGVQIDLFEEGVRTQVSNSVQSLLSDELLQNDLQSSFGRSFRDVQVVIIPGWEITSRPRSEFTGLTDYGWLITDRARRNDYVGGYTIRDRPSEQRVTVDGRPRIILNPSAFESAHVLQLTLFHEMLHAMNVPGGRPPWFCFAQDDLSYLPQYRAYESREVLNLKNQVLIWALGVIFPFSLSLVYLRRLLFLKGKVATY